MHLYCILPAFFYYFPFNPFYGSFASVETGISAKVFLNLLYHKILLIFKLPGISSRIVNSSFATSDHCSKVNTRCKLLFLVIYAFLYTALYIIIIHHSTQYVILTYQFFNIFGDGFQISARYFRCFFPKVLSSLAYLFI